MKSQEELILGDSLQTILSEQERYIPVISEYQFEREVLDLLENPFTPDALRRYGVYVGELTKPLRVVSNDNRDNILHEVPAFMQAPITSIPGIRGITADNFLYSLNRDVELGGRHVNEKIKSFMLHITRVPNYVEVVINPLQKILAHYGRRLQPIPILDGVVDTTAITSVPDEPTASSSSFSDEYED